MPSGVYSHKKGRKHSEATKRKIAIALTGNTHGFKKGYRPWITGRHIKPNDALDRWREENNGAFGEKHPLWVKDRTQIKQYWTERNNPEYKQWRYKVFKRDRYICQMNNDDCGGKVVAHHILPWRDYLELRYIINNGITLCQAHHPAKRAEEKLLAPTFQELISQVN